jgi:hypothetical protein
VSDAEASEVTGPEAAVRGQLHEQTPRHRQGQDEALHVLLFRWLDLRFAALDGGQLRARVDRDVALVDRLVQHCSHNPEDAPLSGRGEAVVRQAGRKAVDLAIAQVLGLCLVQRLEPAFNLALLICRSR